MAILANEFTSYDAVGNREDLSDLIADISPKKTPLSSMIGRRSVDSDFYEWQTHALAAANTGNAHLEGDVASYEVVTPTTRPGNRTQISKKEFVVSGTQEKIRSAGRRSEVAFEKVNAGFELKRDMEAIILSNQGGVVGGTATPRKTAALGAWIRSNTNFEGTGADPADPGSAMPAAGRTDGALRSITESMLTDVLQQVYTAGGDLKIVLVHPTVKPTVSTFAGIATQTHEITADAPTSVIGSVGSYVSDYGTVDFVLDRFQRSRDVWVLDPEFLRMAVLRPMESKVLASDVDGIPYRVLQEWGLQVDNEAAHGLIADVQA